VSANVKLKAIRLAIDYFKHFKAEEVSGTRFNFSELLEDPLMIVRPFTIQPFAIEGCFSIEI